MTHVTFWTDTRKLNWSTPSPSGSADPISAHCQSLSLNSLEIIKMGSGCRTRQLSTPKGHEVCQLQKATKYAIVTIVLTNVTCKTIKYFKKDAPRHTKNLSIQIHYYIVHTYITTISAMIACPRPEQLNIILYFFSELPVRPMLWRWAAVSLTHASDWWKRAVTASVVSDVTVLVCLHHHPKRRSHPFREVWLELTHVTDQGEGSY